ncbi:MFS transporter [Pseudomonas chlororaphis]|uniref:MFS transporter n=1 Tax=Pseudomonas chlororaphis TaxID=587753 RepID=UPI0007B3ABE2|nr:MFS transporter [Pseudomonas chlororaphis]AZC65590.1 putative MFS-type transporter [Pseudomonas chlororaphis subsp. piscium]AZC71828.1 putative MFS-type transporter [Pseudomonas chlororaphis subsp. piscium]AZC91697.1 putative MFS-type transporter [Pseudomonas chlororaphis subsp. piscium]KZO47291.1 MFS transporter [Pseudomonas chlororaphis subsp. piscium]MBP5066568.1 MFS transporter [Pseudomonas chlororaphis]
MNQSRNVIRYINAAHVIDHMFMLIFPAAVLGMTQAFDLDYAALIGFSLGGFIAFGACSLPAGWLGDHWSRRQMMLLFFFGIGASAILTGLSSSPAMLVVGLTLMGVFAAIYHPVGTAMLVAYAQNRGREIGINGMWGNLGVAFSALVTGLLVAYFGWRSAFILPGVVAIALGLGFAWQVREEPIPARPHVPLKGAGGQRISMAMVFGVLALATATGGVVFNATTMTYPKLFQERLQDLFASPQTLGLVVSLAYAFGAVAQLSIGRVLHRFSLKWPFILLTLCQAPLLFGLAEVEGWAVIVLGAAFMFVVFGQVTVNDAMVANFVAPQWQSRVFALRYCLSFGASATAIPLIAVVEPRQGLAGLYLILGGFAALTFAAALIFPRTPAEAAAGQAA